MLGQGMTAAAAGVAGGEPCYSPGNDGNTVLLVHSNEAPGSTTFTDSSASAHSVTANGGITHENDGTQPFGASSIDFNGSTEYLSVPTSSDFTFGTGEFTIDLWAKKSSLAYPAASQMVRKTRTGASTENGDFGVVNSSGAGNVQGFLRVGGVGHSVVSTSTMVLNTWHHIAFVRDGDNLRLYLDGVHQGATDITGVDHLANTSNVHFGYWNTFYYQGLMTEIRVSKGVARWTGTGSFTPPANPYCD